jgi:hypothetical protein
MIRRKEGCVKPVELSLQLPRLSESEDPGLASAVADLRGRGPDAAELASLASRLALQGIAVTAPASLASTATRSALKKWALIGGGALSGVVLWLSLARPQVTRGPAPPTRSSPAVAAQAVPTAPALPRKTPRGASLVTAPSPAAAPSADSTTTATTDGVDVTEPEAMPPSDRIPEQRIKTARAARTLAAPLAATSSVAPVLEGATTGPTEIELLRDARLALKQSPSKALELTESHARTFPGGRLSQERELIAISALVALGRRTAALSRANHFNQAYPASPYRKQIGELLR